MLSLSLLPHSFSYLASIPSPLQKKKNVFIFVCCANLESIGKLCYILHLFSDFHDVSTMFSMFPRSVYTYSNLSCSSENLLTISPHY